MGEKRRTNVDQGITGGEVIVNEEGKFLKVLSYRFQNLDRLEKIDLFYKIDSTYLVFSHKSEDMWKGKYLVV